MFKNRHEFLNHMFDYNFHGVRWGITFLVTDGHLTEMERLELLVHATGMYLSEESSRNVEDYGRYEGIISTKGYGGIGFFYGRQYEAELKVWDKNGETQKNAKLRFLVQEMSKARYN